MTWIRLLVSFLDINKNSFGWKENHSKYKKYTARMKLYKVLIFCFRWWGLGPITKRRSGRHGKPHRAGTSFVFLKRNQENSQRHGSLETAALRNSKSSLSKVEEWKKKPVGNVSTWVFQVFLGLFTQNKRIKQKSQWIPASEQRLWNKEAIFLLFVCV